MTVRSQGQNGGEAWLRRRFGPGSVLSSLLLWLAVLAATAVADDRVLPANEVTVPVRPPALAAADAHSFRAAGVRIRGAWLAWMELSTDNPDSRAIRYTVTLRRTRTGSDVIEAFVLAEHSTQPARFRLSADGTVLAEAAGALWILPNRGERIRITVPPATRVCRFDRGHLLLQRADRDDPTLLLYRIGPGGRLSPARRIAAPHDRWRRRRDRPLPDPHPHYWVSTDARSVLHKDSGDRFVLAPEALNIDGIHGNWLLARSRREPNDAWLLHLPRGEKLRIPAPDRVLLFTPAGLVTNGPAGACVRNPVSGHCTHFVLAPRERLDYDPAAGLLVVTAGRTAGSAPLQLRTIDPTATPVPVDNDRARADAERYHSALRMVHLRARARNAVGTTLSRLYDLRWPYPARMQRTLLEILQADPDLNARRRAAVMLGFLDQPGAAPALLGALADRKRSYFVRQGILTGLGFAGRRADAAAIHQALTLREGGVDRGTLRAACRTLAILGNPQSTSFLEEQRDSMAPGKNLGALRRAIDAALGLLADRPHAERALARIGRRGPTDKHD